MDRKLSANPHRGLPAVLLYPAGGCASTPPFRHSSCLLPFWQILDPPQDDIYTGLTALDGILSAWRVVEF